MSSRHVSFVETGRTLNTTTTFGAPYDVTLEDVVVEAYYPADPAAAALRELDGG